MFKYFGANRTPLRSIYSKSTKSKAGEKKQKKRRFVVLIFTLLPRDLGETTRQKTRISILVGFFFLSPRTMFDSLNNGKPLISSTVPVIRKFGKIVEIKRFPGDRIRRPEL